MDKKLNAYLVEEINKGLDTLNKDKNQLEKELNKITGRDGTQGIEQFQSDLLIVEAELKEKKSELKQIEDANETKERIEVEEALIEEEYTKLLKQKEQCEAEIKKLEGKMELRDGILVPTMEQEEYKRELEKLNASISKIKLLKEQHKSELQKQEGIIEKLYEKYNIKQKYKDMQGKQEMKKTQPSKNDSGEHLNNGDEQEQLRKQQENEMWEEYRRSQEQIKQEEIDKAYEERQADEEVEEMQRIYQSQKEADEYFKAYEEKQKTDELLAECKTLLGKNNQKDKTTAEDSKKIQQGQPIKLDAQPRNEKLQAIKCTIENGKLKYIITYQNEKGEQNQFEVNDIAPHKMTKDEKRNLKKDLHRVYFYGVDNEAIRSLLRNDDVAKTDFYNQYISFAKDMMNGKGRNQKNIDITYDLTELRNADLTKKEKKILKRIAKNSEEAHVGNYIKPKSRFKTFVERLKQKKIASAEMNQEINQGDITHNNLKALADEEGFDIIAFIEQQQEIQGRKFSVQEKVDMMQEYRNILKESQNDIRRRVKYDVSGKRVANQPSQGNDTNQPKKEKQSEGREPGEK